MHKLLLLVVSALLVTVAPAAARTVSVAITKNGYVPRSLSIAAGDSVTFVNQDSVAHQVVLRPTTGVACPATPLVVQPGQSATCTFRAADRYTFTDPNGRGSAFRGTIEVAAAPGTAMTLRMSPTIVRYGANATVSGALASGQPNQTVDLLGQECGSTALKAVTRMTTTAGGAFTASVQPLRNTSYQARLRSATSAQTLVRVRPALRLGRVARQRFALRVRAAQSLVGRTAVVQRYSARRRAWLRVRVVTLTRTVPAVAPTVISAASFRARVRANVRLRAVLSTAQAAPCYVGAASNVIRS